MRHATAVRAARWLTPGLLAVLLTASLAVLAPAPASAFDPGPAGPITWPGTIIGPQTPQIPNNMTPDLWNKQLQNSPNKIPVAPTQQTKVGVKNPVGGVAGAGAVIMGFQIGTEIGSQAASAFGLETNGFWCDLAQLVSGSSGCAVGAAQGYEINMDIVRAEHPGFIITIPYSVSTIGPMTDAHVQVITDPSTGIQTGHFTMNFTRTATGSGGQNWAGGFRCASVDGVPQDPLMNSGAIGTIRASGTYSAQRTCPASAPIIWSYMISATTTIWNSTANPSRPVEIEENPVRWWRTTWQCSIGPGGSQLSTPFREGDVEWPGFPSAKCFGGVMTRLLVEQVTEGLTATTIMYEWNAEPAYLDWTQSVISRGAEDAILDLKRVLGNERVSCFLDSSACVDWFADPLKEKNFECWHGDLKLELAACNAYRPTFNPQLTSQGIQYADPETGALPTAPVTPTVPEIGAPSTGQSDCFPKGWGVFNPLEWVYKPVTCALQWAFVPTRATTSIQKVRTAVATSTVGLWTSAVTGMFPTVPADVGCMGPRLRWDYMHVDLYPFNACDAPVSTWASWTKTLATGSLIIFGSMACIRAVGSGLGWKPSAGGDS